MKRYRRALALGLGAVAVMVAAVGGALTAAGAPERAGTPAPAAASPAPASADSGTAPVDVSDAPASGDRPPAEDAAPLDAVVRKRGVGTLTLSVEPWAEVYEGRRRLGLTPMRPFELPVGRHVLTLKNPQLGVTRQLTLQVTRNAHLTRDVNLAE